MICILFGQFKNTDDVMHNYDYFQRKKKLLKISLFFNEAISFDASKQ